MDRNSLRRARLATKVVNKFGLHGAYIAPLFRAAIDRVADDTAAKCARVRAQRGKNGG